MKELGVYFHRSADFAKKFKPNRKHWERIDAKTQASEKWRKGLEPLSDEQLESMYFMEDL